MHKKWMFRKLPSVCLEFLNGRGIRCEDAKTFTQEQVDNIVQERLAREKKSAESKLSDYEATKQKLAEYEKQNSEKAQKDLEDQKKYDELKKGWVEKESGYQKIITEKDGKIQSMVIDYTLSDEISKHNAYPEAKDVLRNMVTVDKDGNVKIKGKDQYNNDALIDLTAGVKKFLDERPHLVKAAGKPNGGGTPPAGGGGNGGGAEGLETLAELNAKFLQAQGAGNAKLAGELKQKIKNFFASKGIKRDF